MIEKAFALPVAIVVAGVIIAGAILYVGGDPKINTIATNTVENTAEIDAQAALDNVRPVSDEDYVRGDENASVTIIEYSDFECPFCKQFHETMQTLMGEFGEAGKLRWVYRHYPLEGLHPVKARLASVASECVAEQKGKEVFWQFTDAYYARSLSNNRTDQDALFSEIITEMGINKDEFATCIESTKYDEKIDRDIQNAEATGGTGTPWSVLIGPDGTKYPLNGALPVQQLRQIIERFTLEA